MPLLPRLYLFALLPDGVSDHLAADNDVEPALPGLQLVSRARRHLTLLALDGAEQGAGPRSLPELAEGMERIEQAHRIQLARWVMATTPPFAFHVVFDRLVAGPRSTLLKASEPLGGALEAQAALRGAMRGYGVDLPHAAAPPPHVTLGYVGRRGRPSVGAGGAGTRVIDGISWLVDELVLVRSWRGQHWHEELGRWRLPRRRDRQLASGIQRVAQ